MQDNEQISFHYLEWNLQKELVPRHGGRIYEVSPWALTCKDEYYYLIAHDSAEDKIKHFRVDKLGDIAILHGVKRAGSALFESFDIAAYANQTFGMYGGQEEVVTLEFENRLIGVVIDRFGKEVSVRPMENGRFRVRVKIAVSGQFYGWLTGLGSGAGILAPQNVAEDYSRYLADILDRYRIKEEEA